MSKRGHVPIRTCLGCREKKIKGEMIGFKQGSSGIVPMMRKKDPKGRGIYLCPVLTCLKKAQKRNKALAIDDNLNAFAKRFFPMH